jgi:hypothetical protein
MKCECSAAFTQRPRFRSISMAKADALLARIDAEFAASDLRITSLQTEALEAYEGRQERFKLFEKACRDLPEV